MKLLTAPRLHALAMLIWIPCSIYLAANIALARAEQTCLGKRRGQDLKERTVLEQARANLQKNLAEIATPGRIATMVRRLGLPIEPPSALAGTAIARGEGPREGVRTDRRRP